jgi:hypothetical protein
MSEYTDKAGQKRKEMKVTANRVQLMSFDSAEGAARPAREEAEAEPKGDSSGIEEVPF